MKLKIFTATAIMASTFAVFQVSQNQLQSKPDGAPSAVTGSPGDNLQTCAKSGCHTGVAVKSKSGIIKSTVPATGYVPGTTYTITAKVKSPTVNRWGFEISPQNITTGAKMGNLIVTNSSQTKLVGASKYITHTQAGNSGAGTKTWTFNWQAPAAGSGKVKFYGTFLFANNTGGTGGDTTYKSTLLIYEDTIPMPLHQVENLNPMNKEQTTGLCPASLNVQVFPNPFNTVTGLRISSGSQEDFSYAIYSFSGALIKREEHISIQSTMELGSELAPGVYFIQVYQAGIAKTMKIVKTK